MSTSAAADGSSSMTTPPNSGIGSRTTARSTRGHDDIFVGRWALEAPKAAPVFALENGTPGSSADRIEDPEAIVSDMDEELRDLLKSFASGRALRNLRDLLEHEEVTSLGPEQSILMNATTGHERHLNTSRKHNLDQATSTRARVHSELIHCALPASIIFFASILLLLSIFLVRPHGSSYLLFLCIVD